MLTWGKRSGFFAGAPKCLECDTQLQLAVRRNNDDAAADHDEE